MVRESPAFTVADDGNHAGAVVHLPGGPSELELGDVAVKVLPGDVVEDANDAPLEDGEERLGGVGVDVAPSVFVGLGGRGAMR